MAFLHALFVSVYGILNAKESCSGRAGTLRKNVALVQKSTIDDNFRMNTRYGRYGAAYNMVGLLLF
jgi:hypothetical protein